MKTELVIVGGGPAGIAAAVEASKLAKKIVLIDENRVLGGKVLRSPKDFLDTVHFDPLAKKAGKKLFDEFETVKEKITTLTETEVWHISNKKVLSLVCRSGKYKDVNSIQADQIILAVGARDKTIPFPGWHLPGVMTIGGLKNFIQNGISPGKRILITGTGVLSMPLAAQLIAQRVKISAIAEAGTFLSQAQLGLTLLMNGGQDKLKYGMQCWRSVKRKGVPIHYSHVINRVHGSHQVEGASIVQVDKNWHPIKGTEKKIEVDTIATGFGLIPQIEITRLCGCRHTYDRKLGFWSVDRTPNMETSIPGIYVAGDGVSIKGHTAAIIEGQLAAISACKRENASSNLLVKKMKQMRKIGSRISEQSAVHSGIYDIISDDTLICRCEEIRYADILKAAQSNVQDINDLKRRTRLGMGHCQGRYCGEIAHDLLQKASGKEFKHKSFTQRLPLKPVTLGAISGETNH